MLSGLLSSCSMQAFHCSTFSCCGVRALEHMAFSSFGSWALEHRLNSCGTWLSYSEACEVSLDQGLNPCLLHWLVDSLPPGATREAHLNLFEILCFLQACDPGLSRTCDQNIYLSGLCYLIHQDLRGPVLQGHPGYQGKKWGAQGGAIPPSGCPFMGTSMGRATPGDPLPSPSMSDLYRMYKGQRRLGISV